MRWVYRIANVGSRIGILRRSWSGVALGIAICALPELSYALGDPSIVYWFASALLLDILCLVAILLRRSNKRMFAVATFFALCTLLWIVILANRTLSVHVAGAILAVFPILYFGLYVVASMENKN